MTASDDACIVSGPRPKPVMERIMVKTTVNQRGCWLFNGALSSSGYGQVVVGSRADRTRRMVAVHRVVFEHHRGLIPEGLELDHLCRERSCCNPWHLEPVTHAENNRRGVSANGCKTHCSRGHAYDEANTRVDRLGQRRCRTCDRDRKANR